MRALRLIPLVVGLAVAGSASASNALPVKDLIQQATNSAQANHKGILLIFHASWCGWCHQLDKSLAVPALKAVMDKDFVVLHVTVLENDAHKADENPGGADLLQQYGGANQGIPYFVAMDYTGKVVANSKVMEQGKLQNMGFPTEPIEFAHFKEMLKLANPAISEEDLASVDQVLKSRAAEIKQH